VSKKLKAKLPVAIPNLQREMERVLQTETEVLRKICDDGSVRVARADDPEELGSLITEREWFDQRFPQRIAVLIHEHRRRHGKDPGSIRLPKRFAKWLNKRWGEQVLFEVPPERIPVPTAEGEGPPVSQVVIETVSLQIIDVVDGIYYSDDSCKCIELESRQFTGETDLRCGYCAKTFAHLVTERWTYKKCPSCRKTLLIEYHKGVVTVHPYERTDLHSQNGTNERTDTP